MHETQEAFVAALDRDWTAVLPLLRDLRGPGPEQRVAIHARNRRHALIDALAAHYPVVHALVGEEFFRAVAAEFIRRHPPRSAALMHYGAPFAAFLDGFEPAQAVACLADVARLERAWHDAYHCADAPPLGLAALARADTQALLGARFTLHPSVRLVRSEHPIVTVWQAHQSSQDPASLAGVGPQSALVLRPDSRVDVHALEPAEFAFVDALAAGDTLESAACDERSIAQLRRLFERGGVIAIEFAPPEDR